MILYLVVHYGLFSFLVFREPIFSHTTITKMLIFLMMLIHVLTHQKECQFFLREDYALTIS